METIVKKLYQVDNKNVMMNMMLGNFDNGTIVEIVQVDKEDNTVLVKGLKSQEVMWHDIDDLREIIDG